MENKFDSLAVVRELKSKKELLQSLRDYDCESFLAEYSSQLEAMKREIKTQISAIDSDLTAMKNTYDNIVAIGNKYGSNV